MFNLLTRLRSDTAGATAIEYGLILAFICIALLATLSSLSVNIQALYGNMSGEVRDIVGGFED